MTRSSLKAQIGAAALGLSLAFAPVASFAGGDDVSGQDRNAAGGEVAAEAAAAANALQVVSTLSATASTPAAARALARVRRALATNPPGSQAVAVVVAEAIPDLISPAAAASLPASLTGAQAQQVSVLVSTIIASLASNGVPVPAVLATLSTSLAART